MKLYDIELGKEFSFTVYDESASRYKLGVLINQGVGADADCLRLLQEIRRSETQAKYFEEFARGGLSSKELQRAAKLSRSKKFDRETLRKYRSLAIRLTRPVLEVGKERERTHVAYCKTPEYHIFLIFIGSSLNGGSAVLLYAIFVSEFGAKALVTNIYTEYAIYRYLLENDREALERWMAKCPAMGLGTILNWIKREEEGGTLLVIDEELYAFLKSVISLQLIAC